MTTTTGATTWPANTSGSTPAQPKASTHSVPDPLTPNEPHPFEKDARKADVMAPYLRKAAAAGRSQVAAVGVAQEFQRVWAAYQRDTATAAPQYTFAKADRRVTCYYFYL
jgi:hypothetical protein